jgi:hypothetical protein
MIIFGVARGCFAGIGDKGVWVAPEVEERGRFAHPHPRGDPVKRFALTTAALAVATAGMSTASAAPAVYKVTGGGQTLVPAEGGAGDTIAFSAQSQGEEGSAAKGQFQYQDRTGGTGKDHVTVHGTVSCVVVYSNGDGGMAAIGGTSTDGVPFRIDVTDNGSGGDGTPDMILVRQGADATGDDSALCDADDQPDETFDLSRGNVTIHKSKA